MELRLERLELSPVTVEFRLVMVALKLFTVVCRPLREPVDPTVAARLFTCVVNDETELLIELRFALRFVTWLIAMGRVAYCTPEPGGGLPEPPVVLVARTWLTVNGVVLGGTCQVSVQAITPVDP